MRWARSHAVVFLFFLFVSFEVRAGQEEKSILEIRFLSDLDDTLQISAVPSPFFRRAQQFLTSEAYAGVPELMRAVSSRRTGNTYWDLLSGKPRILKAGVKAFLRAHSIPWPRLMLRKNPSTPIEDFKSRKLIETLDASATRYVFFGDDSEKDPEIYAEIRARYPDRVEAIYIRSTVARDLPDGEERVFTSFDIALLEAQAGRIPKEAALQIGNAVLAAPNKTLWPRFVKCPEDREFWREALARPETEEFQTIQAGIISRLRAICAARGE